MNYKEFNDYEIHYLIKENNEEAYELMFNKYKPLIDKLATIYYQKYFSYAVEYEDLIQEGQIALLNAVDNFDESNGALFYTFALLFIKRAMEKYIREMSRYKHQVLNQATSLSKELNSDGFLVGDYIYEEKDLTDKEVYDRFSAKRIIDFKYNLSERQAQVFELRMNNFSNQEIAQLLDINYKSVDNSIRVIKEKFEKYYDK